MEKRKLVDIAAEVVTEWPEEAVCLTQSLSGSIWFNETTRCVPTGGSWSSDFIYRKDIDEVASDCETKVLAREEWEAKRAELKGDNEAWDGEGLPPVGCECEACIVDELVEVWHKFDVLLETPDSLVLQTSSRVAHSGFISELINHKVDRFGTATVSIERNMVFRPIGTAEVKMKREAVEAMIKVTGIRDGLRAASEELYKAIAEGNIPGVKIDA